MLLPVLRTDYPLHQPVDRGVCILLHTVAQALNVLRHARCTATCVLLALQLFSRTRILDDPVGFFGRFFVGFVFQVLCFLAGIVEYPLLFFSRFGNPLLRLAISVDKAMECVLVGRLVCIYCHVLPRFLLCRQFICVW